MTRGIRQMTIPTPHTHRDRLRDVGPVVFPAYLAAEASLRSLAEEKELPIEEVMEAAETNSLSDLLNEEEAAPEEPSETHSTGTPLSSFIR